jgi:hypothetical protein
MPMRSTIPRMKVIISIITSNSTAYVDQAFACLGLLKRVPTKSNNPNGTASRITVKIKTAITVSMRNTLDLPRRLLMLFSLYRGSEESKSEWFYHFPFHTPPTKWSELWDYHPGTIGSELGYHPRNRRNYTILWVV